MKLQGSGALRQVGDRETVQHSAYVCSTCRSFVARVEHFTWAASVDARGTKLLGVDKETEHREEGCYRS